MATADGILRAIWTLTDLVEFFEQNLDGAYINSLLNLRICQIRQSNEISLPTCCYNTYHEQGMTTHEHALGEVHSSSKKYIKVI